MKLLAWLLGPLSFREQLALGGRFLGWLFGQIREPDPSPANSARPPAQPIRYCVALFHTRTGNLIGVGAADFPTWPHAIEEANRFNAGCTLPIVAEPVPLTRAMRRHRSELNKVQILTTIEVAAPQGTGDGGQGTGKAVDDLPHGAPPNAAMPIGYEPSAETPAVWPHDKRRAS